MRSVPTAVRNALASGASTFCLCWRLIRRDGVTLGFTDHDRDVVVAGTVCRAASGLKAAEAGAALGLSAAGTEVAGALSAEALTADDLAAGLYDDATVEEWLVNWRRPGERLLLRSGRLGRVRRGALHFEAELRGLAVALEQTVGRVYAAGCDAVVGDARCGVDLADPRYVGGGAVSAAISPAVYEISGIDGFEDGWFTHGRLKFTSGALAGTEWQIKSHERRGGAARVGLWQMAPARAAAVGDGVVLTAGCDRQFATCRAKFGNAVNYRGFPHMPGNDFVVSYPKENDNDNDGGPLVE